MKTLITILLRQAMRWPLPSLLETLPGRSPQEVAQLVACRYQVSHFFESLVERLIQHSPCALLRGILEENLAAERGLDAAYGDAHWQGRERLLKALGFRYVAWRPTGTLDDPQNVHPASRRTVQFFAALIDVNAVMAARAIACYEALVVPQYQALLRGLAVTHPHLGSQDLAHLREHAELDPAHAHEALAGVVDSIQTWQDFLAALQGVLVAKAIWTAFWNRLESC